MTQVRGLCFCPYEELNVSLFTGLGVISIFFVTVLKASLTMGQLWYFPFFLAYAPMQEFLWFVFPLYPLDYCPIPTQIVCWG